jgi:hypothetical protein
MTAIGASDKILPFTKMMRIPRARPSQNRTERRRIAPPLAIVRSNRSQWHRASQRLFPEILLL